MAHRFCVIWTSALHVHSTPMPVLAPPSLTSSSLATLAFLNRLGLVPLLPTMLFFTSSRFYSRVTFSMTPSQTTLFPKSTIPISLTCSIFSLACIIIYNTILYILLIIECLFSPPYEFIQILFFFPALVGWLDWSAPWSHLDFWSDMPPNSFGACTSSHGLLPQVAFSWTRALIFPRCAQRQLEYMRNPSFLLHKDVCFINHLGVQMIQTMYNATNSRPDPVSIYLRIRCDIIRWYEQ